MLVQYASFALEGGHAVGIIGQSGSGKSTLVRALVGAWPSAAGRIRLDGADLDQWSPEDRGHFIGYLPQDVELFAGSIAENIARFEPDADPALVIAGARA
ncbi:ATP-binding cassette domain-containing protein, partial [Mesorhizobium sp. M2D.F.Ca.ET.160.01.1.1]